MLFRSNFHIITLFPNIFNSYLGDSIIGRALADKKVSVDFYNPRDFAKNKHNQVDDRPYGGGPGMVMQALPILRAVEKVEKAIARRWKKKKGSPAIKRIIFSPGGDAFSNTEARGWGKKYTDIILICGRYEGVDSRVRKALRAHEVSVGDYVLTGGELPAMVVIDAMARHVPGVLGTYESLEEERVSSHEMYTRPDSFEWNDKTYRVPKVLLSGDHKKIDEWKRGEK